MSTLAPLASRFAAALAPLVLLLGQGCQLVGYGTQTLDGAALPHLDAGDAAGPSQPAPDGGMDGGPSEAGPLDASDSGDQGDATADATAPTDASPLEDAAPIADAAPTDGAVQVQDAASDAATPPLPPCELTIDGDCETTCESGRVCDVSCGDSNKCKLECQSGATCAFSCNNADECRLRCRTGSTCDITCQGAGCDAVRCDQGASCTLLCPIGTSCGYDECPNTYQACLLGGQQLCGNNLACPLL